MSKKRQHSLILSINLSLSYSRYKRHFSLFFSSFTTLSVDGILSILLYNQILSSSLRNLSIMYCHIGRLILHIISARFSLFLAKCFRFLELFLTFGMCIFIFQWTFKFRHHIFHPLHLLYINSVGFCWQIKLNDTFFNFIFRFVSLSISFPRLKHLI